ncbi:LysR family transcriptional regulator [Thalassotalea maritima]|uniref:LysR family transcriptional regulator n=1 Tax=Thalassotalea maritima TaxID=3242416 RepID=UPI0035271488
MLNPVWLKTFVTLVDTGHFTKTADKLFMTQPGVSQHIAKLEDACGHALLARDKKSFEITEKGRLVYQYAMQLGKNEQTLLAELAIDEPYKGKCSLACSGALVLVLYPKLLDLQSNYPELIIHVKAAPNHQILSDIQNNVIDIGIVTDITNNGLFEVQKLGLEELCLVLPKNTKINHQRLSETLKAVGLIAHPDAKHYLSLFCSLSQEPDLADLNIDELPVTGFVNQISQILQPVAKGLGFTVLPRSAVDSFEARQKLQIFTPTKPVIQTLYLVHKRNRQLPARYQSIGDVIHNAMCPSS